MDAKLIIPHRVNREFVQSHPKWIFVYSNDHARHGAEGMCWHFVGEPNAFQVSTCVKKCLNSRYFNDNNPEHLKWVDEDIDAIPLDRGPILVIPRIGLGCSRMKELAPKLYAHMWARLKKIKAEYTVDYGTTSCFVIQPCYP